MALATLTDAELRLYQAKPVSSARAHEKKVMVLTWSPSGHALASGSSDCTARTWQVSPDGIAREVLLCRGHTGPVEALAWSPAEAHIMATAGGDRNVILWDTRSGKQASAVALKSTALNLAWTADGQTLAVGTRDDRLHFIDARKAAVIGAYEAQQEMNEFAFAPSGLIYAGMGLRGTVLDEGNIAVLAPTAAAGKGVGAAAAAAGAGAGPAGSAAGAGAGAGGGPSDALATRQASSVSAAGSGAAAAGAGQVVSAAAAGAGAGAGSGLAYSEVVRVRAHAAPVTVLKPSPGWNRFATGAGDGLVCIWDSAELACTGVIDRCDGGIRGLCWSGTGQHLAITHGDASDTNKYLDVVRVDGTLIRRMASSVSFNHVAWCPTAPLLAYALDDPPSAAVAARTGAVIARPDYTIKVLAF